MNAPNVPVNWMPSSVIKRIEHTLNRKHRVFSDLTSGKLPLSSFSHRTSKWVSACESLFNNFIDDHQRNLKESIEKSGVNRNQ